MSARAGSSIFGAQAIAVDRSGNLWVADTLLSRVFKLTVANSAVQSSASFTAGINGPSGIAVDSGNNVTQQITQRFVGNIASFDRVIPVKSESRSLNQWREKVALEPTSDRNGNGAPHRTIAVVIGTSDRI